MKYSEYQEAIFRSAREDKDNIAISAAAGSGKTFTIVEIAKMLPRGQKAIFLAFNSHIKKELQARLPAWIEAKTFHALGYSALAGALPRGLRPNAIDNGNKTRNKCFETIKERHPDFKWDQIKSKSAIVNDICEKARNTLIDYRNVDSVTEMCVQFGIEIDKYDIVELTNLASEIIEWGVDHFYRTGECDFTEMLYITYKDKLKVPKFAMMLIDECQDMNPLQIEMINMCADQGTRVIMVGDPYQAIYGFTGALSDSFDRLRESFKAKEMPLSICYRCPISHIKVARTIDGNRTEWAPNAIEGKLEYILQDKIPEVARSQDLIICRLTAPLLSIAVKLIARKVGAVVLGRNIGEQLTKYIDDVMKQGYGETDEPSWADFIPRLESHTHSLRDKIAKQRNPEFQLEMLNDKEECIKTCYTSPGFDTTTMDGFKHTLASLFSDKRQMVTLATVHRVKGLEADRVFVIVDKGGAELMPLRWKGQLDWQFRQELNIAYVAYTRAKQEMYICCSNEAVIKNFKEKHAKVVQMPVSPSVTEKKPEEKVYDNRFQLMNELREESGEPPFTFKQEEGCRHTSMLSSAFDESESADPIVYDEVEIIPNDDAYEKVKEAEKAAEDFAVSQSFAKKKPKKEKKFNGELID